MRGDYEAARSALRAALTDLRAHPELGDDPEPQIQEAYAAALIRLAWLAEGRPAAFAATASLEPVVRNSLPVRFAVCLAKDVEPIDYALRTHGGLLSRDLQQARETPEVDACIALLAH